MKSLIVLVLAAAISWHFTALESSNKWYSIVAPIAFMVCLAGLAGWLVKRLGFTAGGGDGGYFGDGDGGSGGCGGD